MLPLSYVPNVDALDGLLRALGAVAPGELVYLIRDQLDQISGGCHAGLLTIGVAGALCSPAAMAIIPVYATGIACRCESRTTRSSATRERRH